MQLINIIIIISDVSKQCRESVTILPRRQP